MRIRTVIGAMLAGLMLITAPALSDETDGDQTGRGPRGGFRRQGGPGGGPMRGMLLRRFDKDGDGKLNDEEKAAAKAAREEHVKKFDKDGDGELNQEERKAAREAIREQVREKMAERKKEIDTDGDGKISEEERDAARAKHIKKLFEKADKDDSGSLSPDEFKAALKALRRHRPGGRGGPGGQGGPGGRRGGQGGQGGQGRGPGAGFGRRRGPDRGEDDADPLDI